MLILYSRGMSKGVIFGAVIPGVNTARVFGRTPTRYTRYTTTVTAVTCTASIAVLSRVFWTRSFQMGTGGGGGGGGAWEKKKNESLHQ